ncbi:hypothetical protein WR25_02971 isoform F [Diploscapter pachys]|nr:hypothetical protein WR25_02971 isoform F [Diploscapter pachys]
MTSPAYMSSALRPDNRALYSWPTRFYSPSQAIDNLPTRRLSYLDSAQIEGPLSPPHRPPLLEHQLTSPLRTQMNYPLGAMATSDILPITGIPINTLNAPVVERPPPPLDKARLEREALFANYSLSFQRILFYFTRYPAIVMIFVASWVLWGRGLGEGKPQNETVAYSVGFATGITAILANVVLTLNHHYKYKKARYLVFNLFLKMLWHSISEQSLSHSCCIIVLWSYGFIDFFCDRFQYREKYKNIPGMSILEI